MTQRIKSLVVYQELLLTRVKSQTSLITTCIGRGMTHSTLDQSGVSLPATPYRPNTIQTSD